MKTHQEIHDAIEERRRTADYFALQMLPILHALNDRITAIAGRVSDSEHNIKTAFDQINYLAATTGPR